jgi:hypothetical protein
MSNLKISQLPDFTGSTAGSWLIANNAAESETFKIEREIFLIGYAPSTDLTALSSSIAVTDLNQNNTIATLATTGSNTFIGTETISGSVVIQGSGNTALNVNGGNSLFSGSIIINGSSPSGTKFLFFNNASGSAGAQINYAPSGNGILGINAGVSGSISIGTTQAGINTLFGNTRITGSQHAITGSLGIRGDVQVSGSTFTTTGSLTVTGSAKVIGNTSLTGSLNVSSSVGGDGNFISSYGGNFIYAYGDNRITSSMTNDIFGFENRLTAGNNFLIAPFSFSTNRLNATGTGSANIINATGVNSFNSINGTTTLTGSLTVSGSTTLNCGGGNNILTGSINAMDSIGVGNYMVARGGGSNFLDAGINQLSGSTFNRIIGPTTITGSLTVTGSIIQTGSVQGNVLPLTITSNTASLNLNNGNFFTLQLVSGSATHLNPSNIKPGQTVSVFVNTTGSATMTFPSSIKQISGSLYVPTPFTGLDVLTLISKDTSSLYLVNAKNFV